MLRKISLLMLALVAPIASHAVSNITMPQAASQPNSAKYTSNSTGTVSRGQSSNAAAYRQQQINNYYAVNTVDVDSKCREKIYNCLTSYCGDINPATNNGYSGPCQYATDTQLYSVATLCIQKDYEDLMPQYNLYQKSTGMAVNTAARLCPSYIQQELMSYLSMSAMADQLSKQRSQSCIDARAEFSAAQACAETAFIYGGESATMLESMLTDSCGAGVAGGSKAMVLKFVNAGNVGGNVWGWAEKIITLDTSEKAAGWEDAINAIVYSYVNRVNNQCGDNMVYQAPVRSGTTGSGTSNVQALAGLALQSALTPTTTKVNAAAGSTGFPTVGGAASATGSTGAQDLTMTVISNFDVNDYATAKQVVQAGLTMPITTQNPFLTSAQMQDMQTAQKKGTKVFMLKSNALCYIVAVDALTANEQSLLAPVMATCSYN